MGPFGPELLSTRTPSVFASCSFGRRSNVGMVLGRDLVQSLTVIFSPPDVQLWFSVDGASQESIMYRFVVLLLRFSGSKIGLIVDYLSFRGSLSNDIIGNRQNIVAVTAEFSNCVWRSWACSHVQYTIPFGQYVIQLVHCMFGVISQISKYSMLPMLYSTSRWTDWTRAFVVDLLVVLLCSGDSRTDESISGLPVCGCDRVLGQLNQGNPWILKSISPRQVSLYVPPCLSERSEDFLSSEIVVSWRS